MLPVEDPGQDQPVQHATDPTSLDHCWYWRLGPVELYLGNAHQVLAASVDPIVTSPSF